MITLVKLKCTEKKKKLRLKKLLELEQEDRYHQGEHLGPSGSLKLTALMAAHHFIKVFIQ